MVIGWWIAVGPASAGDSIGSTWPEMPIRYAIASNLHGLDDGPAVDAVQAAFDTWDQVECGRVRFESLGRTDDTFGILEGRNTVAVVPDWTADPALRASEALAIGGSAIQEADLALNLQHFVWVLDGADGVETFDLQAGMTFAVGRLLGLTGSTAADATMNPATIGDPESRTLADDDVEAICALYPSEEAAAGVVPLGGACTASADCEEPFRCVSDAGEQYCAPICPGGLCPATYVCLDIPEERVCTKAGCGCATGGSPIGAMFLGLAALAFRGRRGSGAR